MRQTWSSTIFIQRTHILKWSVKKIWRIKLTRWSQCKWSMIFELKIVLSTDNLIVIHWL